MSPFWELVSIHLDGDAREATQADVSVVTFNDDGRVMRTNKLSQGPRHVLCMHAPQHPISRPLHGLRFRDAESEAEKWGNLAKDKQCYKKQSQSASPAPPDSRSPLSDFRVVLLCCRRPGGTHLSPSLSLTLLPGPKQLPAFTQVSWALWAWGMSERVTLAAGLPPIPKLGRVLPLDEACAENLISSTDLRSSLQLYL